MEKKKRSFYFAFLMIISGLILESLNIGENSFFGFASVGVYLIYIGFIGLIVFGIMKLRKKKNIDERMESLALKSGRITFIFIISFAFLVMIIDGIKPIQIPYSIFMSYFIMGMVVVNVIVYQILLKKG